MGAIRYRANSEAILRGMEAKMWNIAKLADESRIDPKTIRAMLDHNSPRRFNPATLKIIEDHLELAPGSASRGSTATRPERIRSSDTPVDRADARRQGSAHLSVSERLAARGVRADPPLDKLRSIGGVGIRMAIGDALLDQPIAGYRGVDLQALQVENGRDCDAMLPKYVLAARDEIPKPARNGAKLFLTGWRLPVIDDEAVPRIVLSRSDWWTTLAIEKSMPRLHDQIAAGELSLSGFPRRLDLPIIIVTGDERLVLCRRSESVRYYPGQWEISVGEQMDAKKDVGAGGSPSPYETAVRALTEWDELNVDADALEGAEFKCVALATEWPLLVANLITVVRLPRVPFGYIADRWSPGEHDAVDSIEYSIETCLELITRGAHGSGSDPGAPRSSVNHISRLSLLAALFSDFTFNNVVSRL